MIHKEEILRAAFLRILRHEDVRRHVIEDLTHVEQANLKTALNLPVREFGEDVILPFPSYLVSAPESANHPELKGAW